MNEDRKIVELNLDDILPNRFQPRIKFDEKAIIELSGSIKEHGVIQPILVREIGDKYEIIAGERRYKASALAGKETIPAIITNLNDKDSAEVALIENIQRKDLTPIEEAISYKKILDMGYLNQEALAAKLDRNQSTISNKLRLLNLDDEVQDSLLNNKISERHARSLLRIENKVQQKEMLYRIINERLTVRRTDEEIDKLLNIEGISEKNRNEDNNMEIEEPKGIFNIPSTPIIEEIEIFDELDDDVDIPNVLNDQKTEEIIPTNFKPGFLDIDEIEKNAEEINVEKPLADLDSLLKINEQSLNENNDISFKEEIEDPKIKSGKFFSFIDNEENENNTQPVLSEAPQFNNFEFDLNDNKYTSFDNLSQIDNKDDNNFSLPEINYNDTPLNPSVINNEIMTDYNISTESNSYAQPDYNFNFDDLDIKEDYNLLPSKQNNNINDIDDINPELQPDYTIPGINDIQLNNDNSIKDFNEVINDIRNYSKKIEDYGFFVDVDEIDFGDSYQVIFKINKIK